MKRLGEETDETKKNTVSVLADEDSSSSSSSEVATRPVKKKSKKNRPVRQPDRSRVDKAVATQIYDAVVAALQLDCKQPVLLHIQDPDGYTVVAYWPRNKEVGLWLLETLEVADQGLHTELCAAIAWPHKEDVKRAFEDLFNGAICTLDELGEFATLTDNSELRHNDDDNGRPRMNKKDLCAFLYTQYCRIYDD